MVIKIRRWSFWGFMMLFALAVTGMTGIIGTTADDNNKVVAKIPTTQKVVALTLDDGPHYKTTPEMLKVLREKQVKVTMFVLGENVEKSPELLAQAVADGHEIASHGYSHKIMSKLSKADYEQEMDKAESVIMKLAPKPTLFRPPGGAYNAGVLAAARSHGYTTVMWNIDPHDWQRPSVDQVVNVVMNNIKPGSIVLLHDGQYPLPTAQAISIIIDRLRAQGYRIVTVSELLQYYEAPR